MAIEVHVERETLVKPSKTKNQKKAEEEVEEVELSAFDRATYDANFSIIFFFRAPTFCNTAMEEGLVRALSAYPEWAGRLLKNPSPSSILLNNRGARFVEAKCNSSLVSFLPSSPNPNLLHLHGAGSKEEGDEPLLHIQLTRFACGGLAVGISASHAVADGVAACSFWIKWGEATRGLSQPPRLVLGRKILPPRNPLKIEFDHRGAEYDAPSPHPTAENSPEEGLDQIIVEKVHFSADFVKKLKSIASLSSPSKKYCSTFEALVAHLWRRVTRARGLETKVETRLRIAVNGRRRVEPKIPDEYLGNVVLWAFPAAEAAELRRRPLGYAAELIREAVGKLDERYFRSFVDFSEEMKRKKGEERLCPTAEMEKRVLSPNLEVDSWLRFPFYDVDFGGGPPDLFTPTWMPYEGYLALLPSPSGYSGIDVLVGLFRNDMKIFKRICYTLNDEVHSQ